MKINGTVLISERNRGFLTALTLLVQKEFDQVIVECDQEKILRLTEEKEIDIIVMDTGANLASEQKEHLDFIRKIDALGKKIQVIILTNFSQNQFGLAAVNSGAFDFVPKPWNNERLIVTLRNAYRMKELETAQKRGTSDVATTIGEMEKKLMEKALERQNGNVTLAAQELGITRQTLYNKGKKYNLFK